MIFTHFWPVSDKGWTYLTHVLRVHLAPSSESLQWTFMCNEEYCCLQCDTVYYSGSSLTFSRNIQPPSSGSNSKPSKESAKIKQMETVQSSMTSVSFYWTTQHHILEESILHSLQCESLKSNLCAAFVSNIYNRPNMSNVWRGRRRISSINQEVCQIWTCNVFF